MATIGGITCTFVKPDFVRGPKQRLEVWQSPGLDGYGAQSLGLGDAEFRVTAVFYEVSADVEAWFRLLELLQGTIVSITDDWGLTYTGLLIVRVGEPLRRAAWGVDFDTRGELRIEGVKVA